MEPVSRITEMNAVIVLVLLPLGYGVYAHDNSLWPFISPRECPKGQYSENGVCVPDSPTANAGLDQTVKEGDKVMLNGSGSDDSTRSSLTYSWKKLKGISVSLDNNDKKDVTFFAPQVTKDESIVFQLTVSNGKNKASDTMKVTIRNVDKLPPPDKPLDGELGHDENKSQLIE